MTTFTTYASGMTWGEGPRWHDGALWLSDTQGGRLWSDADGTWMPTPTTSVANGLWFLPDGRLIGALMDERRLGVWSGAAWQPWVDLSPLDVGPLGDLVGDRAGNLYVDDVAFAASRGESPRPGRIILVRADGSTAVAATGVEFPNGLALIDDDTTLVVAETSRQRLTAFTVAPDGTLVDPMPYADIAALVGADARPDGLCADGDEVWAATTTGRCVVRIRRGPDGAEVAERVDTTPGYPIACCLDEHGDLFVTLAHADGQPLLAALARKAVTTTAVRVGRAPTA